MTLYETIKATLDTLSVSNAVGLWRGDPAPAEYCVITPIGDQFIMADDAPIFNIPEARIVLYSNTNYLSKAKQITNALLSAGANITERTYLGYDDSTNYHAYAIGVEIKEDWEETPNGTSGT